MKKTISINLNRQVFNLDIDAYPKLDNYLSDIKKHFDNKDSSEIIDDIESHIAEKFTEILGKNKKVVQIEDVDRVIADMGSVSDITGDDSDDNFDKTNKNSTSHKKLFRDVDRKMIAGVASGLAWYFGIRSLFIRLIFVVFLLNPRTSWLSLVVYFACWLIIPKAKNNFEKLEMKGRPATINELQTVSETKISGFISSVETKTQNVLQKIISVFGHLIKLFFQWGTSFFWFFSFIFTIFCIVAVSVGLVVLYFNPTFPYFNFSFIKTIPSPFLEVGLISFGLIFLIPLIFILDLSENLMQLKWLTSFKKVLILLIIWFASLVTFASVAKINYSKYQSGLYDFVDHLKYFNSINESNSQQFKIVNPENIDISNIKEVKITQSDENIMVVTGSQHQIKELEIKNSTNELSIHGKNEVWYKCQNCTGYVSSVRVEIKTNNPKLIKLDNVDAEIYISSGNLIVDLVQKTGLKVSGILDSLKLTTGPACVVNLFEVKINRLEADLHQTTLKSGANVITITGDDQSRLIYKNNSKIISSKNDKTIKQKYSLSRDNFSKLNGLIEQTSISFDHQSQIVKNFSSSRLLYQLVGDYSNIYLIAKPLSDKSDVYLFWLTEKDEKISQINYLKLANWDNFDGFDFVNNNLLEINGQLNDPEMTSISQQVFIDKTNHKLVIYNSDSNH